VSIPANTTYLPVRYEFSLNASVAYLTLAANPNVTPPTAPIAPQITLQPVSTTAAPSFTPGQPSPFYPSSATFTATASGTPTPTVQWYVSREGQPFSAYPGATSPTLSFPVTPGPGSYRYEATFTNSAGSATTTPATLEVMNFNINWAGYVDTPPTGQSFTGVSGSWVVPTAACTGITTYQADWIGLDSTTVEQIGTDTNCNGATPSYSAWYEFYGDNALNAGHAVTLGYSVRAGDAMSASVTYASGTFTLTLSDATAGWTSSTPIADISPPAARATAEWIVEAPIICDPSCARAAVTPSTPVTFTGATVTTSAGVSGPLSSFSPLLDALLTGAPPNAAQNDYVSFWDPSGTSFTVTATP
jgi:hypothetical protein